MLEIRGKNALNIEDNATFTFTGSGYVKFDMPHSDHGVTNIIAGTNSKINLTGSGKTDKVLEVQGNLLHPPDHLEEFKIRHGKVEIGENLWLNLGCPVDLFNVKFTKPSGHQGTHVHNGVHVYGQGTTGISDVNIIACDFENAKMGIFGQLYYGTTPLRVLASTFTNCDVGIRTVGLGVDLDNSSFSASDIGWDGIANSATSIVNLSDFTENRIGIQVLQGAFSLSSLTGSNINSNEVGIHSSTSRIRARCGSIKNNQVEGIFSHYGHIELTDHLNAGYVDLSGNDYGLFLDEQIRILLYDGYNDLRSDEYSVYGDLRLCFSEINANYNRWNSSGTALHREQNMS